MSLTLVTGPQFEPLSVAETKLFLRVDTSDDDVTIAALITTARVHVERLTHNVCITQTWRLLLDELPTDRIVKLKLGPVANIREVLWFDRSGIGHTVSSEQYQIDITSNPARILFDQFVPSSEQRALNGLAIDFDAGFGETTLSVPQELRHAMLMLVAHWYENRSAIMEQANTDLLPVGVADLIQPYRSVRVS